MVNVDSERGEPVGFEEITALVENMVKKKEL
jgi:hypothetical protein